MRILLLSIVVLGVTFAASEDGQTAVRKGPARRTSSSSGSEMYRAYCAACHGQGGKGDGPARSALKSTPTDLTQLAKRNSGRFPELQVFGAINGDVQVPAHGSKDMPVWGALFWSMSGGHEGEVQQRTANLSRYIESLQAK